MRIAKHVLAKLPAVYSVCSIVLDGKTHFLAASEGRDKCLLFSPPDWRASEVWPGPGGAMCMCPLPGHEGAFLAIQGLFPGFVADTAGLHLARRGARLIDPWTVREVASLPYVHRMEVVNQGGVSYVVAATVCSGKTHVDDWSQPGAVYIGKVPEPLTDESWRLEPVLTGISKNHGMHVSKLGGELSVFVSGHEGIYRLHVPSHPGERWQHDRVMEQEVSDLYIADLDGDGKPELLTIEPFHGHRFMIYKSVKQGWEPIFESSLSFGHVVWGGTIAGAPSAVTSSRSDTKDLALFRVVSKSPLGLERLTIDAGVGASQIAVVNESGRDLIFSSNNGVSEVVLYEITP